MRNVERAIAVAAVPSALLLAVLLAPAAARAEDPPPAPSALKMDVEAANPEDSGPEFKKYLRLHAGPIELQPELLLQAQAIPYVGPDATLEAGDPADTAGFRMRRARFGVEGRIARVVPFEFNMEFNSDSEFKPSAILHDAWFGYDVRRWLQFVVGFHDVPFSRSAITRSGDGALIERPFAVRAMSPFHQLGVHVEGQLFGGGLGYSLGLYNGLQKASYFYQGFIENPSVLGNRLDGLTYAARLTSEPLGSIGPTTEDLHHDKLKIAAGAGAFYSDGGTVGVLGLDGDLLLHVHGFHLLGEFLANRTTPNQEPTAATVPTGVVTSYGGVGEAGYVILRETLGVSARFEWVVPNTGVQDQSDDWFLTGGVSYHLIHDLVKAQLDYTHRQAVHGAPLHDDSVVIQTQLNL